MTMSLTTITKRTTADLVKGGRSLLRDLLRKPVADDAVLDQLLGAAEAELVAARQRKQEARAQFDQQGDDASLEALEAADAAERGALQHVGRAERLLKQRDEQRAAERRAALEARRDQLIAELDDARLHQERAPLVKEHADLLLAAVRLLEQRRAQQGAFNEKRVELHRVKQELGLPSDPPGMSRDVDHDSVCTALEEAWSSTSDRAVRAHIDDLVRALSPGRTDRKRLFRAVP
jgi:hypothetical protein